MNQFIAENWGIFPILLIVGVFILLVWLAYFLYQVVNWTSRIPDLLSPKDILNNSALQRLMTILEQIVPLEAINFQRIFNFCQRLVLKEEELESLQQQEEELSTQKGEIEAKIQAITENMPEKLTRPDFQQPPKPPKEWYEIYLPLGLSLMLILGIFEFLGIDIQSLEPSLILLIGVSGAICINLAEYHGLRTLVEISYRRQRQSNSIPPFQWKRLPHEPNVILTIIIIFCEMCFAAPGILNFYDKDQQQDPKILLTVYAACALAALVNALIAWGEAKKEVEHEFKVKEARQRHDTQEDNYLSSSQYEQDLHTLEKREQQQEEIARLKGKLGEVSAHLASVQQDIQRVERKINELNQIVLHDYGNWSRSTRFWLAIKGKKVTDIEKTLDAQSNTSFSHNNGKNTKTSNLTQSIAGNHHD